MDRRSPRHDKAWRERMVSFAREPDSEFTALRPGETGLPMTVYASERSDYETLIVDSQPGLRFAPSADSQAFGIGEHTGDPDVDTWVKINIEVLRRYAKGQIDTIDFYRKLRSRRSV